MFVTQIDLEFLHVSNKTFTFFVCKHSGFDHFPPTLKKKQQPLDNRGKGKIYF